MIEFNCKKCGHSFELAAGYAGTSVTCKKCGHVITIPPTSPVPSECYIDVKYKADGMTPDFDELFQLLAKEEREAPVLINC